MSIPMASICISAISISIPPVPQKGSITLSPFVELDKLLYKDNRIKLHFMWSMFIDETGIPINKPPYGEVVSYDLNSFKINNLHRG